MDIVPKIRRLSNGALPNGDIEIGEIAMAGIDAMAPLIPADQPGMPPRHPRRGSLHGIRMEDLNSKAMISQVQDFQLALYEGEEKVMLLDRKLRMNCSVGVDSSKKEIIEYNHRRAQVVQNDLYVISSLNELLKFDLLALVKEKREQVKQVRQGVDIFAVNKYKLLTGSNENGRVTDTIGQSRLED